MSIKYNQSKFDMLKESPLNDSLFFQGFNSNTLSPPPGSDFMITEITEDVMITESGDYMITE